ncbi:hypothetical protein [Pseudomonas sp. REB1044]|uniref:hypothetical protein n=1 Tax=unclassified Pseudomonas TaxID=196821 RepID=UPI00315C98DB
MDDHPSDLYRVAEAIVSVPCSITAMDRQDILDSLLLAQLYASRQHDALEAASEWATTCLTSLNNLHWGLISSFHKAKTLTDAFSVKSVIEHAATVEVLDRLSTEARQTMHTYSTRQRSGLFQVKLAIVRITARDRFNLMSLLFNCAPSPEYDWINQQHYASLQAPVVAKLNEASFSQTADYADVRMKVVKALGAQRLKEIQLL